MDKRVRGLGTDLERRPGELKGQKGVSGRAEGGTSWTGAEEPPPPTSAGMGHLTSHIS